MHSFPFRFGLLCTLLGLAALLDLWRHGACARRWKEYSFLLAAGGLGALFGALVDQVSCSLSPAYFEIGKEIPAGPGFRWRVAVLGAQAGCVAGIVSGGIILYLGSPGRGRSGRPLSRLVRLVPYPLAGAVLLAPLLAYGLPTWDPLDLTGALEALEPAIDAGPVLTTWRLHLGLYAGGVLGLLGVALRLRPGRAS